MTMRPLNRRNLFALLILSLWSLGCGGDSTSTTTKKTSPAAEITLKEITKPELDAFVQSNKGKVVLVELWATW